MNEIAMITPDKAPALTAPADSIVSKIIELASIPGTSPEMFDRLVAWQEREQAKQALVAYDDAMSAAQAEISPVVRTAWNDQTKSRNATLDGIDEAIRPIYTKHGFSVSFTEVANDNTDLKLACIVSRSGHSKTFYLPAALDTLGPRGLPNKTQVQGVGSTVSYLRRYLLCLAFNVATRDDNDGNRQRDTGEVIGRGDVELLAQLISECAFDPTAVETNERGFLNSFGFTALASLKQIPAGEFPRLKTALLNKKQGQRARTGEAA